MASPYAKHHGRWVENICVYVISEVDVFVDTLAEAKLASPRFEKPGITNAMLQVCSYIHEVLTELPDKIVFAYRTLSCLADAFSLTRVCRHSHELPDTYPYPLPGEF
jgi:hypothetical protein